MGGDQTNANSRAQGDKRAEGNCMKSRITSDSGRLDLEISAVTISILKVCIISSQLLRNQIQIWKLRVQWRLLNMCKEKIRVLGLKAQNHKVPGLGRHGWTMGRLNSLKKVLSLSWRRD